MNYKAIFKTLLIGMLVFALAVALGMKFNWARYLSPDKGNKKEAESAGLPASAETLAPPPENPDKSLHEKVKSFQILDEKNETGSTDELIRNDCIRASRRAGVTDEHIFEVVNQCVEMSKKEHVAQPVPEAAASEEEVTPPNTEDSLELTRKACKIVADEEQGLSAEERQKAIEQCVKANMGTP